MPSLIGVNSTQENYSWTSKGILEESIKNPPGCENNFPPILINSYPLPDVIFGGNWLINGNISVFRKIINLYISYKLDTWSRDFKHKFQIM